MERYSKLSGVMAKSIVAFIFIFLPFSLWGQVRVTYVNIENQELLDFFRFEEIEYVKLSFTSEDLADKTYQLSVKEIHNGEITKDSVFLNCRELFESMGYPDYFKTVGDTVLEIRVISKLTAENKLKMNFMFPRFSFPIEFDAIETKDKYSLRFMGMETVEYDESFYLLAYILPYDLGNGMKSYCEVDRNGKDILNWGGKFGIKHYLVFEMKFEPFFTDQT